jgi:hypothetical protein
MTSTLGHAHRQRTEEERGRSEEGERHGSKQCAHVPNTKHMLTSYLKAMHVAAEQKKNEEHKAAADAMGK